MPLPGGETKAAFANEVIVSWAIDTFGRTANALFVVPLSSASKYDARSLNVSSMRISTAAEHQASDLHQVTQADGLGPTSGHDRQRQRPREDQGQQGEEGIQKLLGMHGLCGVASFWAELLTKYCHPAEK